MNIKEEKAYIKAELDKVEDINLVIAIKKMLDFGKSKKYEQNLYPMPKQVFYERNRISVKAIEEDKLISQEEAKAYFKKKNVNK